MAALVEAEPDFQKEIGIFDKLAPALLQELVSVGLVR
jgi:hypothetical protein